MNKLFIIKIGGNVLDNAARLRAFLKDFASIKEPKILIHGGGKIATNLGNQLGIESNYVNGRRITDAETLDLVTMVYGGLVNKQIVASASTADVQCLGSYRCRRKYDQGSQNDPLKILTMVLSVISDRKV